MSPRYKIRQEPEGEYASRRRILETKAFAEKKLRFMGMIVLEKQDQETAIGYLLRGTAVKTVRDAVQIGGFSKRGVQVAFVAMFLLTLSSVDDIKDCINGVRTALRRSSEQKQILRDSLAMAVVLLEADTEPTYKQERLDCLREIRVK